MSIDGSPGSRPWWGAHDDATGPESSESSAQRRLHWGFVHHYNQQTAHEPAQLYRPCWGKVILITFVQCNTTVLVINLLKNAFHTKNVAEID